VPRAFFLGDWGELGVEFIDFRLNGPIYKIVQTFKVGEATANPPCDIFVETRRQRDGGFYPWLALFHPDLVWLWSYLAGFAGGPNYNTKYSGVNSSYRATQNVTEGGNVAPFKM
jgi:hypothetical protein